MRCLSRSPDWTVPPLICFLPLLNAGLVPAFFIARAPTAALHRGMLILISLDNSLISVLDDKA